MAQSEAKEKEVEAKARLKPCEELYDSFKETVRILRKLKYNT